MAQFKLSNVVASVEDDRDYPYDVMAGPYPVRADLRKYAGGIENQQSSGSCVANATVSACELILQRGQSFIDLSRQFLYDMGRIEEARQGQSGMQPRTALKIANNHGVPPESVYPYRNEEATQQPADDVMTAALTRKLDRYERIMERGSPWVGVEDISNAVRSAITEGCPVTIAMPVGRMIYAMKGPLASQVYPALNSPGNEKIGNHDLLIVGYGPNGFFLENSWGPDWGDLGYGFMSWQRLENTLELWAIKGFNGFDNAARHWLFANREIVRAWVDSMMGTPQTIINTAVANDVTTDDFECIMGLDNGFVLSYATADPVGKTLDWTGWL